MADLWFVDLDAAAQALEALEREVSRLSVDDRDRAQRLRDPRERQRRLAAYAALRVVLERTGGPHVRGKPIIRPPGGKPRLGAMGPTFSISHTDGLALIGVAGVGAIGVDLEKTRRFAMSRRRREEILAAGAGLAAAVPSGDADDETALLRAWCRLEATAKARGIGLAGLLKELGLREVRGRQLPLAAIETSARHLAQGWGLTVRDVKLPSGLYGAIAGEGGGLPTEPHHFPTEREAIVRLLLPRRDVTGHD
jgi:phosphopantetheinyl transferase